MAKPIAARTAAKQLEPFDFKPGQSGNPKGRPRGSRDRYSEAFLKAMLSNFESYGPDTIETVRVTDPSTYLRVAASLIPKELNMTSSPFDGMSDDEFSRLFDIVRAVADAQVGDGGREQEAPRPSITH